jgi:hypothetical protein
VQSFNSKGYTVLSYAYHMLDFPIKIKFTSHFKVNNPIPDSFNLEAHEFYFENHQ